MKLVIKITILFGILCFSFPLRADRNPRQVIIIGIDALEYNLLMPLMRQNRLPNFARLAENSVIKEYQSEKPLRSPAIWTTIASGQSRRIHGIYDFMTNSPLVPAHLRDSKDPRIVTSNDRKIKALWNFSSEADLKTVVVSWIKTWPAESINGVMVAPYAALNSRKHSTLKGGIYKNIKDQITPSAVAKHLFPLIVEPGQVKSSTVKRLADFPASGSSLYKAAPRIKRYHYSMKWSLAHTETTTRLTVALMKSQKPRLVMAYFEGADSLAHRFWAFRKSQKHIEERLQAAGGDPSVAPELKHRFGKVLEGYYEIVDQSLGLILDQAESDAIVMVLSDHGFRDRTVKLNPAVPYDGQHRLEGVMIIGGLDRYKLQLKKKLTIYDIAPTAMALLGLPIPRDLQGQCLLTGEDLDRRTVRRDIQTMREKPQKKPNTAYEKDEIKRLRSLGYVK